MKKKKIWISLAAILLVLVIVMVVSGLFKESSSYAFPAQAVSYFEEDYQAYLDAHGYNGSVSDAQIAADLTKYDTADGLVAEQAEQGVITGDTGSITFYVTAEQAGFYNLEVGYITQPGTTSDIQRKLYINGEIPYSGLDQLVFKRYFQDEEIKEKNGNEIRPNSNEVYKETKVYLEDYNRRSGEPYLIYLNQGVNSVTFEVIKEPIEFTSLIFQKAPQPKPYIEVIEDLKQQYKEYSGDAIVFQAERCKDGVTMVEKNSSSINIQKNYSDSKLVPYHPYLIKYNTIGADSWKQPGNAVSWEITVPQEGLYELTFKGRQSVKRGVTAYRRLYINGVVPYAEMNAVGFSYQGDMTNYTISNQDNEPYLFYFKEGSNTITLECVMGDMGEIISEVENSMYNLNKIYLEVVKITGQAPDRFIDYEISKKIPEFAVVMKQESERLYSMVDHLVKITGEKGENTTLLEKMAIQAEGLSKKPDTVPEEISQFKDNISALGTWLVNISEMPLELDSFILSANKASLPKASQNILQSAYYGTIRFFSTFFVDTSQISGDNSSNKGNEIKVWMVANAAATGTSSSGREQAQIIQNLIDEVFTPENSISVNLQLIPVDVVLRAALAGNSPDVVIGLNQATLQDFAMRNAVVDLKQMDGFEETIKRFYPSTITAASYLDGVYGIPEQATFMMLFCRNDILEQLGVTAPKTWEEVKEILPVLQKNNYSFYLPTIKSGANVFPSILFQNGGNLYQGEGRNYGIASALTSDIAMQVFKDYTDLFNSYGLEVSVDFSNRFRTGEIPIGITNYTTYNQLEIFAPELKGLWSFYELPGVEKEDGTIDHTYVVDTVQSIIMQSSKNKEDSWKFIQWWTKTQTQLDYANTIESIMGTAARYSTADPEVMKQLPWSNKELTKLLAQFEETIGIPAVPGSYMNQRMVQYAFDKVVAELANPRETLYLNVKAIDKELLKKRKEFHLE